LYVTVYVAVGVTVTAQVWENPPSAVTVMVALPAETPVTFPPLSTDATALLLLFHTRFWLVAFAGAIVAVSGCWFPVCTEIADDDRLTPVTGITVGTTDTVHCAMCPPSTVVAVIVVLPAAFPVTLPNVSTVAIVELLLDHVTF